MFRLCIHTCNLVGGISLLSLTNSLTKGIPKIHISIYRPISDGDGDKSPRYEGSSLLYIGKI